MNAAFFEVTKDSTTIRVHNARRKALAGAAANPSYDLWGLNAWPSDVRTAYLKAGSFGLFSGMGHGGPNEFESQNNTNLYDLVNSTGSNHTVKSAIVHLYSCNCGKNLGPHLVSIGAKAFIGYTSPVIVPLVQAVVDEYVKVSAAIDRSILNGDGNALTKSKSDAEFAAVNARLRATGSAATPRDLANFRINHRAMVGPWTDKTKYGWF